MMAISPSESDISSISIVENMYDPVEVSNLITDKYALEILMYTYKKPKSIQNISSAFGIPIAMCYRRVRQLEKLGFLRCVGKKLNGSRKWHKLYQSQIVNAHFFLEKGKFRVRVQLSSGIVDDFGGSWSLVDINSK
jgi:hypothetical protein